MNRYIDLNEIFPYSFSFGMIVDLSVKTDSDDTYYSSDKNGTLPIQGRKNRKRF